MNGEQEQFFNCPYCLSPISMLLESYYSGQNYIEDCEVCCRPISITYNTTDGEITSFNAQSLDE